MEVYRIPSKKIQEIIFANATYEAVIEGLNGYFASEPRNDYITVKMESDGIKQDFVLYEPEAWADILIEWLRKKHDIFYRPGMTLGHVEAARSAAKMCRLRAHIKDEIRKRGLWFGEDEDIPELVDTLFKAYDEEGERADKNRKEVKDIILQDIMNDIRQESSRNGFEFPEEIDGEPLTVKRVFHDLLELLRMKETRIKTLNAELATKWTKTSLINWLHQRARHKGVELDDTFLYSDDTQYDWTDIVDSLFDEIVKMRHEIEEVNDKRWKDLRDINKLLGYDGVDGYVDDFAKTVKARAECTKRALGEESDINKLIREYCTKHGIVAPSRYLGDEACVEYLFSVIDLKQKDRSFTILQDLYRDIFKKQPDGLSAEDIANKILDRVLKTEDLLHKSVDSVNKECKATGRLMVDDYKLKLKSYILKDIKEHGYRYDGLQSKSIEEIVDWIITMATLDRSSIALRDIYTTVASPAERLRYNDCDGPTVDHMKDYILRRFEGLHANTEYCLKKMSELDGCQKDLKILEEQQEFLIKQSSELATKLSAKDDEISRLKDLINAMNEEVRDM